MFEYIRIRSFLPPLTEFLIGSGVYVYTSLCDL